MVYEENVNYLRKCISNHPSDRLKTMCNSNVSIVKRLAKEVLEERKGN